MPRLLSGIQGQGIQRGIHVIGHCRMVTKAGVTKGVTTELSICRMVTKDWLPVAVTSEAVLFEAVTVAHVTDAVTAEAE